MYLQYVLMSGFYFCGGVQNLDLTKKFQILGKVETLQVLESDVTFAVDTMGEPPGVVVQRWSRVAYSGRA